jgi:hypothetical protein
MDQHWFPFVLALAYDSTRSHSAFSAAQSPALSRWCGAPQPACMNPSCRSGSLRQSLSSQSRISWAMDGMPGASGMRCSAVPFMGMNVSA